jgi:hypothetical protein
MKRNNLNSSANRHSFQADAYLKRRAEEGKTPENDAEVNEMFKYYQNFKNLTAEKEADPEWKENNMEYDLRSTPWICDKVSGDDVYAQNLYAAMCNNEFQRNDMIPILKDQTWSCSWRYAGGIIADMRERGDYIDWYCSGIRDHGFSYTPEEESDLTAEQLLHYKNSQAYVSESIVTAEIRSDLKKLGWLVLDDINDNF